MDGAAADDLHDVVADLLELESLLDEVAMVLGQLQSAADAQEVGSVQEVDVEHVALDPLPAVEEAAQGAERLVEDGAADLLDRLAGARLVGDRADPADAGGDVGGLGVGAAAQERLEEAGRLVDAQADVGDLAVGDDHVHGALALDPGEPLDGEIANLVSHRRPAPFSSARLAASKAGAVALKVRKSRITVPSSIPPEWRAAESDAVLGVSIGPKQP